MSITLKLYLNTSTKKVFFAEAEKDFIDFMSGLLTFPLASIVKELTPSLMVGSVVNLYHSVEKLDEIYFVDNKAALVDPNNSNIGDVGPHLNPSFKYYQCLSCKDRIASARDITCPCGGRTEHELNFIVPPWSFASPSQACVTKFAKYLITDDLDITPVSALSILNHMSRFNCNNDTQWEEKCVVIGMKEGLALLQASLKSRTTLSDVFFS